jgi:iron complex outermembrane recepter protein
VTKQGQVSVAVLLAIYGAAAFAQEEAPLEEVRITGSRIRVTNGMETPNPVTVVTTDEVELLASGRPLADGLAELPQFSGSNTTASQGSFFSSPTAGSVSLRGLRSNRTLNLINGRRIVPANLAGLADVNLFPESVMRSVEIVTGGASAAYGTDAVSGVVNFILDTDFVGYRASAQLGQNYNDDNRNHEYSMSASWKLGEKGHLLLSGERYRQAAVVGYDGYDWYRREGYLPRPNNGTRGDSPENAYYAPYSNIVSRTTSLDSIIHFPTAALGSWEVLPDGSARPFVLGNAFDNSTHSIASGGSGSQGAEERPQLQGETGRQNLFAYADYDVTDNLNLYVQGIYGEADTKNAGGGGTFGAGFTNSTRGIAATSQFFTIFRENPFLPANIQQLMTANNLASVRVGRIGSVEDLARNAYNYTENKLTSVTAGFNYRVKSDGFFKGWGVEGYYQSGENEASLRQEGGVRLDRIYLAVDAVRDNNGNIVCNVTRVSGRHPDCVPLNIFGRGNASDAAVDWVTGYEPGVAVTTEGWLADGNTVPYSYVSGTGNSRILTNKQKVAELSADGELFDGFGAGPVSMALGAAWREESFVQRVQLPGGTPPNYAADPRIRPVEANNAALGIRGVVPGDSNNSVVMQFSKVGFGIGSYDVKEAFTEFHVPLLSGLPFIRQLDAAAAARWASYSGSGTIWSWKAGLEWLLNEQVRLRGTLSRDVRAGSLAERFEFTSAGGFIRDPADAGASYSILAVSRGNPAVDPERAKTLTFGVVLRPNLIEGFQASIDYYDIIVRDNIAAGLSQEVVDECEIDRIASSCALIERNGDPIAANPGVNRISLVNSPFRNYDSRGASGVDVETSYTFPVRLFGGSESVNLRLLGSKLLTTTLHLSGARSAGVDVGLLGYSEWTGTLSTSYLRGPFSASLNARYESGVKRSGTEGQLQSTAFGPNVYYLYPDNSLASTTSVNARLGYRFDTDNVKVNTYLSITNLLNADPRPFLSPASSTTGVTNGVTGDLLGRRYSLGVNLDF